MPAAQEDFSEEHLEIGMEALGSALKEWQLPALPQKPANRPLLRHLGRSARARIAATNDDQVKTGIELAIVDWLYQTIRQNIKRGRLFEVNRVLEERQADCLGYSKLFLLLGKMLALDTGIVEVVVDNAGRFVPHVANIVRLSNGRKRFVDLWYGSCDVNHRRLGLAVKQHGRWRVVDADRKGLPSFSDIKGLPARCIDAITLYMIGNRHLDQGIRQSDKSELDRAVGCYTKSIGLYPQNARFYFNRAIAFENMGNRTASEADYAVALRDEASLVRVQARQYDEVVQLMFLDRIGVSLRDQDLYLLRRGFVTGKKVSPERVAARYGLSVQDVKGITSVIETRLAPQTERS